MTQAAPAQVAKGALRRLALAKQEPTPENYARAYAEEAGQPPPSAPPDLKALGPAWALLIEKLARGLERPGKQWTAARKKDSLQRVLDSSRGDLSRLQQRLQSLIGAWEGDLAAEPPLDDGGEVAAAPAAEAPPPPGPPVAAATALTDWPPMVQQLDRTVRAALPGDEPRARELAAEFGALADEIARNGASRAIGQRLEVLCDQARRYFGQRHRLVDELGALAHELGQGLSELAEDESWAQGQCASLAARLSEGLNVRSVRAASALLAETRQHQRQIKGDRDAARDALKTLINRMLSEIGALGEHTGRFEANMGRHVEAIQQAQSLEGLAGVVREMVEESRAVHSVVAGTRQRLNDEHARATELETRVRALEGELRRLSDEVSTDALTQVANRRGLAQAFDAESARAQRAGPEAPPLAIGLIDIDNFKKLNDTLGHSAGDEALRSLAAAVRQRLRPADHLARFGGEEFVVLLPSTPLEEAQQALTRLQRSLSEALFLHDGNEVFVTFSAGVTVWRGGEPLATALERADEALYEAKRTGKNRTCTS